MTQRFSQDPNDLSAVEDRTALLRRKVLQRGLLLGGVAAAAPLVGGEAAHAAADPAAAPDGRRRRVRTMVFDVAMLGDTLNIVAGPGVDNGDLRGSTFYVEGPIYPGGTIPRETKDWDPSKHTDEEIGRWFDMGSFMNFFPDRPNPRLYSTMTHVFGLVTPENNFPADMITSTGTEASTTQDTKPSTRAITGGAGKYIGARGEISVQGNGTNVTPDTVFGRTVFAPNLTFTFTLLDDDDR